MSEIDFEELDRAVSSLMNQSTGSSTNGAASPGASANSGAAQQSSQASTPLPPPAPDSNMPSAAAPASEGESAAPAAGAAPIISKRPVGRFMDVVHPSSDMRTASMGVPPSARPSRELAPLSPVSQDSSTFTEDYSSANHDNNPMDDPVSADLLWQGSEVLQNGNISDVDALGIPDSGNAASSSSDLASAPMDSPFLANVDVDKRPLGQTDQPAPSGVDQDEVSTPNENQEESMPDPISNWQSESSAAPDFSSGSNNNDEIKEQDTQPRVGHDDAVAVMSPIVPELSQEVLAVESNLAVDTSGKSSEGVVGGHNTSSGSDEVNTPGDIPVQYKPEAANAPEPSAVFDVSTTEPQELQHPESKKSGWMVVVWILLLLIIGAGGGVAVWYFLLK